MGRRHERRRLEEDLRLDRLLQTDEGRAAFWAELLAGSRRDSMAALLASTLHLPGDVVECGVYRGGSLRRICRVVADRAPEKVVYACDSFGGFPDGSVGRIDLGPLRFLYRVRRKFRLCDDTPARLERFFELFGIRGRVEKGPFSETLPSLERGAFCFVHLDCDLYASYRECLSRLYDRLAPGGVVVFDDYGSPAWPGAKRAVDEFFAAREEKPRLSTEREKPAWYVRKPGEGDGGRRGAGC